MVTGSPAVPVRVLTWNLFHGRDRPPGDALFTRRSRLLRVTERNATHAQVNRPLLAEFTAVLARAEWDVALLQEAPPRWHVALRRALGAEGAIGLTSRNLFGALGALAADLNPDLVGAWEGGSNQVLVRPPWRIAGVRHLTLTRRPERRTMVFARVEAPALGSARVLCVANLHASLDVPAAAREVVLGAGRAVEWAGSAPLAFGGDLNLWPERAPETFAALRDRHGLAPPTAPKAIDHILVRGARVDEAPHALPPSWREVPERDGTARRIRLSDHAAVTARVAVE